jgi:very-short-patch-repair endonuclease
MYGLRFRRQQPVGPFIVDFFCAAARLVIELDGVSHEGEEKALRDAARDAFLQKQGLTVVHIMNEEIYNNLDGVLEMIAQYCRVAQSPLP